jgi:hypothetical protein
MTVSDSREGSVHEIYVRQIDSTRTYLSHLISYVNIFTMFLHVSSVIPVILFSHETHKVKYI